MKGAWEMEGYGTFDIETLNWIDFEILGAFDGQEYFEFPAKGRDRMQGMFHAVKGFVNLIDRRKYRGWRWYAHNGGRFDFLFLIEYLLKHGYVRQIFERPGRIICIKCEGLRASWELCDSYALIPGSLRDLAQGFDVPHKKMAFQDYTKIHRSSAETRKYLRNDCLALYEVIDAFRSQEWMDDELQLTIASQALHVFKTRFMDGELEQMRAPHEQTIRDRFYSGGRVEVFKGHGLRLNSYDVNSLFPWAMAHEMPTGQAKRVLRYVPGRFGFYKVRASAVPDNYLGLFLVRMGTGNYYVNGPGEYYLSSESIEFLRREFGIRFRIEWGLVFPARAMIFDRFVSEFYKIKSEAKGTARYLTMKILINSFYGKLGAKREQDTLIYDNGQIKRYRLADPTLSGYGMVITDRVSRSKFILPYLAAWVTDTARLHHLKMMLEHPEEMYYCDTDSLYTTADYSHHVGPELGKLSDTGKWEGLFLAPKTYALRRREHGKMVEHIAFKGFASDEFSFAKFRKAINGESLTQEKVRMLGFREGLNRKAGIERRNGQFLILATQRKIATGKNDRRLTFPDSDHIFDSRPFRYRDLAGGD